MYRVSVITAHGPLYIGVAEERPSFSIEQIELPEYLHKGNSRFPSGRMITNPLFVHLEEEGIMFTLNQLSVQQTAVQRIRGSGIVDYSYKFDVLVESTEEEFTSKCFGCIIEEYNSRSIDITDDIEVHTIKLMFDRSKINYTVMVI